jgi:hypothetical protein
VLTTQKVQHLVEAQRPNAVSLAFCRYCLSFSLPPSAASGGRVGRNRKTSAEAHRRSKTRGFCSIGISTQSYVAHRIASASSLHLLSCLLHVLLCRGVLGPVAFLASASDRWHALFSDGVGSLERCTVQRQVPGIKYQVLWVHEMVPAFPPSFWGGGGLDAHMRQTRGASAGCPLSLSFVPSASTKPQNDQPAARSTPPCARPCVLHRFEPGGPATTPPPPCSWHRGCHSRPPTHDSPHSLVVGGGWRLIGKSIASRAPAALSYWRAILGRHNADMQGW